MISIFGEKIDAWGWTKTVAGKTSGGQACSAVRLAVNGSPVKAKVDGERFTAIIPVQEGENKVTASCEQASQVQSQEITVLGRLRGVPTARIQVSLEDDRLILDASGSEPAEGGSRPVEFGWTPWADNPAVVQAEDIQSHELREWSGEIGGEKIAVKLPEVDGEYYFTLRVADQEGREDASATYIVVENKQPRIPDYDRENSAWIENTVVYGVIPRKIGDHGFRSITEKLDYLADLGVNALWLSPVNVSPPGDYGYAVVDYFNLNPKYGTKDDFRQMIQEAHKRDIRILMDFVPNHTSAKHPYFLDAVEHGQESPYWNFYDRDENGRVTHYFDWEHLPNLNYNNPEVEQMMLEGFSYWVREFDVDGFRVDACWGVMQRKPDFWPKWRRELKRIKPDLLLLAEASALDPYYFDNGFDAAYDWTHQLGHWAWENVWKTYKHNLLIAYLDRALTNAHLGYTPDALIFRFLNNNDTETRFITTYGEGMARVATALLLTLPGLPCVYTGDEIGAWFKPYYDPNPLTWEEKYPGLREYHKQLIALRKSVPSLHSRQWLRVDAAPQPKVYAYLRFTGKNEQPVLVMLNFFDEPVDVEVTLPEEFRSFGQEGLLKDLLKADQTILAGNPLKVPIAGYTARILVKK